MILAAAAVCLSSLAMNQWLASEYEESVAAFGTTNGLLAKTYVNPETHTWTITVSGPNGQSCILGSGYEWREIDGIVAVPEADEEVIK